MHRRSRRWVAVCQGIRRFGARQVHRLLLVVVGEKPNGGVRRVGKRPFVESSSAPVGVPGQEASTSTLAAVKRDAAADTVVVAPRPAAPSLMSIVEDVSRSNRGWSEESKMRKSVGGSRNARVNLLDGTVVRAPPPVSRGTMESLNMAEIFGTGAWVACGVSC